MARRLPVTLRRTPGGYSIQIGPDPKAMFYFYTQHDETRIVQDHMRRAEAEPLVVDVARALRNAFVTANKHGGG